MEIFYLKKSEFLPNIDLKKLDALDDGRKFLMDDKKYEHLMGLFLVKFIGKNFFNMEDTTIIIKNKKPYFAKGKIFFSITHSNDIVLAAFETSNVGVDIEYMKERDYKSLLARYDEDIENPTKEQFYKFWTKEEAKIKLGEDIKSICTSKFEDNYMLTCVCNRSIASSFVPTKLVLNNLGLKNSLL